MVLLTEIRMGNGTIEAVYAPEEDRTDRGRLVCERKSGKLLSETLCRADRLMCVPHYREEALEALQFFRLSEECPKGFRYGRMGQSGNEKISQ
ncbi:MAG: hypothetical protein IJ133_05185 [Clostridia bacterium]|nr:hypothetical protein [Clostridia bacterium]